MAMSKGEQYFIDKLKAEMDEDGVIKSIDKETRSFLKNRYQKLNLSLAEKDQMHSISELIARLIPGAIYVTNAQASREKYSKEAIFARLDNVIVKNSDGEEIVDLGLDPELKEWFRRNARSKGVTAEQLLEGMGFRVKTILNRDKTIPITEHISNALACADAKKNIVGLSKKFPSTHHYICYLAKKNKCSYNIVVNQLLGSELQEYTYVGTKNRLSKFDKDNPTYIGSDEKFKEQAIALIKSCMDENGEVHGLYSYPTIYKMFVKIANWNDMKVSEVIKEFVPSATYIDKEAPTMKHQTKEDVISNLARFNDGSGCIDSIRANKNVMKALRREAKAEGLHVSEFVEKYSDFYFSSYIYEINYIDNVISRLVAKYGFGGNVSGITRDDPRLYEAVHRIKNFFPGGAKASMEETFEALGFSYEGMNMRTRFTEGYVRNLLEQNFGDGDGLIDSIYDLGEVGVAVMAYSGKLGKSIKETIETFGYSYTSENKKARQRLSGMKMTPEEYSRYKDKHAPKPKTQEPGEE